ncbi:hypothetical protein B0H13DRAFT_1909003 [Mycena leptocephala]|nr:hypothetical protein B0H13DRAFT_1909003 [Mycena leptocephala]
MSSITERQYSAADLEAKTKKELAGIIQGQIQKWPEPNFNASKIKKDVMIQKMLKNGFTMEVQTAVVPAQGPDPPSPETHPTSERHSNSPLPNNPRPVDLLLEDMRVEPPNKFIQDVLLSSYGDLATGEWIVSSNEVLAALQKSPSSLDGPVKLSFDDAKNPGWKRYFVKVSGLENLENASTSPAQLTVSEDSRLKLFVEHSGPVNILKRERSASEDDGKISGSSAIAPPRKRSSHPDQEDVTWLKTQLSKRPGYNEFQKNQGKKLTNKERVSFWRFAAAFTAMHFNKTSGAEGRLAVTVKKVSIESALVMSATALAEAEKMTKILETFGEGGEKCAKEVTDRASGEITEGRAFIQFLESWNKSH